MTDKMTPEELGKVLEQYMEEHGLVELRANRTMKGCGWISEDPEKADDYPKDIMHIQIREVKGIAFHDHTYYAEDYGR